MNFNIGGFFLIIILSSRCNCEDNKVFTLIFGSSDGSITTSKSDQPEKTTRLSKFINEISGLAIHNDYLYVATKVHSFINRDSAIWRCKITNTTNFSIDERCQEFDDLLLLGESILSMVVAKDYIYAGRSDDIMWRCSANDRNNCENFNRPGSKITGLDYNPKDGKIFASLSSGTVWRCSANFSDSCDDIYRLGDGLTAIKVDHDFIWVGTEGGKLMKCPMARGRGKSCDEFAAFDEDNVVAIGAASGFLYVNSKSNKMWQCEPDKPESCRSIFSTPTGSGPFVIV